MHSPFGIEKLIFAHICCAGYLFSIHIQNSWLVFFVAQKLIVAVVRGKSSYQSNNTQIEIWNIKIWIYTNHRIALIHWLLVGGAYDLFCVVFNFSNKFLYYRITENCWFHCIKVAVTFSGVVASIASFRCWWFSPHTFYKSNSNQFSAKIRPVEISKPIKIPIHLRWFQGKTWQKTLFASI